MGLGTVRGVLGDLGIDNKMVNSGHLDVSLSAIRRWMDSPSVFEDLSFGRGADSQSMDVNSVSSAGLVVAGCSAGGLILIIMHSQHV